MPGTPWNTCPVLQMLLTGCKNSFGDHGGVYFPRGYTKVATYYGDGGLRNPGSRKYVPCDCIRYGTGSSKLLSNLTKMFTAEKIWEAIVIEKW